ncbi:MAG: energy-dependent translational throttle protein EttA [Planctomycetota bacterium]|nr:energy-dependent translational throttle protein EttA [Planctomycetota bacterium]
MADKIIFQLQDLKKYFGQVEVLKGITLSFLEGAKIGLIGPNGAGKSTLLRIMSGEDKQFEGTAMKVGDYSIGYLSQEPPLTESKDVAGNLREAVQELHDLEKRYNDVCADMDGKEELFAKLQEEMDHKDVWNLKNRLEQAATALDLPPMEADVTKLSGGERRRVALCKLLLAHPDMLLLDEPTNHLDADSVEWLEQHLKEYQGTVILITHDRYFLDNVVGWMLEIERGRATPYKGNYSDYLEAKRKLLEERAGKNASLEKLYQREKEWIGSSPSAQRKRAKWRLDRFKQLQDQRAEDAIDVVELRIPPGPRLGDKVIHFKGVSKAYGDRVLLNKLTFEMPPGSILGVVGANGVGKSTTLKMIMGKEKPDSGTVDIGSTVMLRYLDQSRAILDDQKSVYDNITEGNPQIPYGGKVLDGRAYVARFNFKGEDQQKLLGECSGGMRNRVLLAKMLREPANVILMDEPTNDLDLDTLRVLEEAISEYPGSAIVVSHDRYFLNRVATHILAFEGEVEEGKGPEVSFFAGDFEAYHEWREAERKRRGLRPKSRAGKYAQLLRD